MFLDSITGVGIGTSTVIGEYPSTPLGAVYVPFSVMFLDSITGVGTLTLTSSNPSTPLPGVYVPFSVTFKFSSVGSGFSTFIIPLRSGFPWYVTLPFIFYLPPFY